MEADSFYSFLILLVLLVFSAIFSGSEVALFSLNQNKVNEIKDKSDIISRYIFNLIKYPRRLLATILISNTIVNVAASIISVTLALKFAQNYNFSIDIILFIQIISLTVIIILFCEITPKILANKYPVKFSKVIAFPLYWIHFIINPISKLLANSIKFITANLRYDKSKTALSTEEIAELADMSVEKGTIEEGEHELIHGLVSFKSIFAKEVMTPRVDMVSVSSTVKLDELIELIKETGFSRIPVYQDNLDNIIGIIYAKDILPFLKQRSIQLEFSISKLVRDCLYVPETKLISQLMHEFQEKNMHMAIVVDEYGGTSGLITLEDILEEIVGEIRDEYDNEQENIIRTEDNKFIMFGNVSIDELEETLKIKIENLSEDFETLGGYILNYSGTIPDVGFEFIDNGYLFKVLEISNKRIKKVEISKLSDSNL